MGDRPKHVMRFIVVDEGITGEIICPSDGTDERCPELAEEYEAEWIRITGKTEKCVIRDWWMNVGLELLGEPTPYQDRPALRRYPKVEIGRAEINCRWDGYGEDAMPSLWPEGEVEYD